MVGLHTHPDRRPHGAIRQSRLLADIAAISSGFMLSCSPAGVRAYSRPTAECRDFAVEAYLRQLDGTDAEILHAGVAWRAVSKGDLVRMVSLPWQFLHRDAASAPAAGHAAGHQRLHGAGQRRCRG